MRSAYYPQESVILRRINYFGTFDLKKHVNMVLRSNAAQLSMLSTTPTCSQRRNRKCHENGNIRILHGPSIKVIAACMTGG
jgi:hypothetical protein